MRHHHYMKYLFVFLLFLPTCLMAQNKEENMPGHCLLYTSDAADDANWV